MDVTTNGGSQALEYGMMAGEGGLGMGFGGLSPSHGWSAAPYLTSSDALVLRNQLLSMADARDLSRTNGFAKSALRNHIDSVIGSKLKIQVEPDYRKLGVDPKAAEDWVSMVESEWEAYAESDRNYCDARRLQTFSDLMRTAYASYYVGGEALGTVEWRRGFGDDRTCLLLIAPERLSDPRGMFDHTGKRRMGVERDQYGAPVAYHIRERHPSDGMWWSQDSYRWKRVERYTWWGRQKVIHHYKHDQPDMTRGLTEFIQAALPLRMLADYARTELESGALRATYAAVIESELDYDDAMKVIGPTHAEAMRGLDSSTDGLVQMRLRMMKEQAAYYRGQDVRFGKSKVAHLMPNEELKVINGNTHMSALKDFQTYTLYEVCAALGVDYASLSKDYTKTNYSGARASLFDVWRGYESERQSFMKRVALPLFGAWLEERIAIRETMPMLGGLDFYKGRDAVVRAKFETWGKPRIDPLKEAQADITLFNVGAGSLKDLCADQGRDWRDVLDQRAREKAYMDELKLTPEDLDWALINNQGDGTNGSMGGDGGGADSGGGGGGQ